MGHQHHGHHHHDTEGMSDSRLHWAIGVNLFLTIAQVVGGIVGNSLALIADALHNLNDAASLILALVARRIGRKPADEVRTFGYRKAPVVGALINLTTLIIVGLYLMYEALTRFFAQPEIAGWMVVGIAGVALIVDLITAALTFSMAKESMNIKAAFIHNVSDALASIGVIISGSLIILFDWYIADLFATLLIAGYILYQGFTMIGASIRILMDSAPEGFSLRKMVDRVEALEGVVDIHHVHVWHLDEHRVALEAHVTIEEMTLTVMEGLKKEIKGLLKRDFDIHHTTLEFEISEAGEHDQSLIVG